MSELSPPPWLAASAPELQAPIACQIQLCSVGILIDASSSADALCEESFNQNYSANIAFVLVSLNIFGVFSHYYFLILTSGIEKDTP